MILWGVYTARDRNNEAFKTTFEQRHDSATTAMYRLHKAQDKTRQDDTTLYALLRLFWRLCEEQTNDDLVLSHGLFIHSPTPLT